MGSPEPQIDNRQWFPRPFLFIALNRGIVRARKTIFMLKIYLKKMLMAVVALLCSVAASGYNFEVDGICYNVTSETDLTVEIIEGDYKYRTKINNAATQSGCRFVHSITLLTLVYF